MLRERSPGPSPLVSPTPSYVPPITITAANPSQNSVSSGPSLAPVLGSIATVGEYISSVVLKELWSVQTDRYGSAVGPRLEGVKELLAKHAPDVTSDILDVATGWIPVLANVTSSTMLPDLDMFPPAASEAETLSLQHRKLLHETFEILLDSFNDLGAGDSINDAKGPLLPRPCIASISVQVAALLERLVWLRSQEPDGASDNIGFDLAQLELAPANSGTVALRSTKVELVNELQQCRQRIFFLEKDLSKQVRSAEATALRAKREHESTNTRLLEVNHAMGSKLKQQIQENKVINEKLLDYEQRIKFEKWRATEQSDRIEQLEKELAAFKLMQDDMLVREKQYGRRILNLHLHEFESTCRNDQRMRKLGKALAGESKSTEMQAEIQQSETDLANLAQQTLERLKTEFNHIFDERQQRFFEVVRTSGESLQSQQAKLDGLREQTYMDTFGCPSRSFLARSRKQRPVIKPFVSAKDIAVQTELACCEGSGEAGTVHVPNQSRGPRRQSRNQMARQGGGSRSAYYPSRMTSVLVTSGTREDDDTVASARDAVRRRRTSDWDGPLSCPVQRFASNEVRPRGSIA
mmetsp:Transcript_46789/g.100175  ORF Transcript_46789/g.100175 Transcript_46789/m.100175 type:complete len:580 (-) Transcript_46789:45-1784(-)